MGKDPLKILQDQFKISSFRPGQREIIDTILSGEDVLGIMPTGAGKSICYQIPALIFEGVSIVISPLIALMKDQVDALRSLKIPATFINSTLSPDEVQQRIGDVRRGQYKLLYIAPERFYSAAFMKLISTINVSFVAVDEAHCISQWGHDFRPSYLKLKTIISYIGNPPVAAFTATATEEVRRDILKQLDRPHAKIFISGFDRPNLKYFAATLSNEEKNAEMLRILPTIEGSGIVYVSTQKAVDSVSQLLNDNGIKAIGYHGGMDKTVRHEAQDKWLNNEAKVIVATNAFGMGIDKFDVRFVLHYNMPGSLEAYYQEAGRAGRDGKTSYCILFYNYQDRKLQEFFIENNYPPQEVLEDVYNFLFDLERTEIYLTYREIGEACGVNEMSVASSIKLFEQYGILQRMNRQTVTFQVDFIVDEKKAVEKVKRADIQKRIVQWLLPYDGEPVPLGNLLQGEGLTQEQFTNAIREIEHKGILIYTPPFRGRGIKITSARVPWGKIGIDFKIYEQRMQRQYEKLDLLESYIEKRICRRKYLLGYFGEKYGKENCHACDICLNWHPHAKGSGADFYARLSGSKKAVMECVEEFDGVYGVTTIASLLKGVDYQRFSKSGLTRSHYFGLLTNMERKKIIALIYQLIREGRILKSDDEYPVLSINQHFVEARPLSRIAKQKTHNAKGNETAAYNNELYSRLKKLRLKLADDLPPYFVCSDEALKNISLYFPVNKDELLAIKGLGKKRVERFGEPIIEEVIRFVLRNPLLKNRAPQLNTAKPKKNKKGRKGGGKEKSHIVTYRYFQEGFSLKEIAEKRGFRYEQIANHIIKCIKNGIKIDIDREVSPVKQRAILDAAAEVDSGLLKDIKERLPETFTYEEIKLTLAKPSPQL